VGVGQGIAGLPLYSGMGFRLGVWCILTTITVVYLTLYAHRTRQAPAAEGHVEPEAVKIDRRQGFVMALLMAGFAGMVVGALWYGWGILEMAALFLAVGIASGLVGGLGANGTAEKFVAGAASLVEAALVVGLARGVLIIFDGAKVTDTILHALAGSVEGLPSSATVVGIYGIQLLLNFLIPSGSGQAALSLPILAPLGDLVGVTRQTTVLAYQLGDGILNIVSPTQGYFMAALALIGIPWTRWIRFIWPLICLWMITGLGVLLVAHAIQLGPF
jgi:uncharacterized ion transporter superfamily protein YfcC